MAVSAVVLEDIKRPTKFLDLRTDKNHVVALGEDGLVRIWKLDNQDLSQPTILVQAKNSTALALHMPFVVIGLTSGDLHLWDTRSAVFKTLTTGMSDFIDDIYITTIGDETYICATAGDELAVIKGQDDQYTPGIIIRPFDRPGLVLRNTLSTYQGHIRLVVTGIERQSEESPLSIAHVTWRPDDFFGTMKCTALPAGDGHNSGPVQAVLDMKDSGHILIQYPEAELALLDGHTGQVKWRMLASTEPENVVEGQGCFTQFAERQLVLWTGTLYPECVLYELDGAELLRWRGLSDYMSEGSALLPHASGSQDTLATTWIDVGNHYHGILVFRWVTSDRSTTYTASPEAPEDEFYQLGHAPKCLPLSNVQGDLRSIFPSSATQVKTEPEKGAPKLEVEKVTAVT